MAAPPLRCPGAGGNPPWAAGTLSWGSRPLPAVPGLTTPISLGLTPWVVGSPRRGWAWTPAPASPGQPGTLHSAQARPPAAPRRPAQLPPGEAPGFLRPALAAMAARVALCGRQPTCDLGPHPPHVPPGNSTCRILGLHRRREEGAQPSPREGSECPGDGQTFSARPPTPPTSAAGPAPQAASAPGPRIEASIPLARGEPSLAHEGPAAGADGGACSARGPGRAAHSLGAVGPGATRPLPWPLRAGPGARLPALTRHLLPPAATPAPRSSPGSEPLPWAWRPGGAAMCVFGALGASWGGGRAPTPHPPGFTSPFRLQVEVWALVGVLFLSCCYKSRENQPPGSIKQVAGAWGDRPHEAGEGLGHCVVQSPGARTGAPHAPPGPSVATAAEVLRAGWPSRGPGCGSGPLASTLGVLTSRDGPGRVLTQRGAPSLLAFSPSPPHP